MLNPHARAETHVGGEDTCFWLTPIVNGKEVSRGVIHVDSIQQGERQAKELERVIRDVYEKAYKQGVADLRKQLRQTIGLS